MSNHHRFGNGISPVWTVEQDALLKAQWETTPDKALAKQLSAIGPKRTELAVTQRRFALGFKRERAA